ncbi:uncharacterized protein LOC134710636 [Mytilus trossulus]|uniref:uncharacterized protein LOC134710636 n=1 Tax=Mytilus trossulus TaxID=6551 RepID=UPI0030053954
MTKKDSGIKVKKDDLNKTMSARISMYSKVRQDILTHDKIINKQLQVDKYFKELVDKLDESHETDLTLVKLDLNALLLFTKETEDKVKEVQELRTRIIVILLALSGVSTGDSGEDSSDSSSRENFVPSSKKQEASSQTPSLFEESGIDKTTYDKYVTRQFQPSDGKESGNYNQQFINQYIEQEITAVNNEFLNPKYGDLGKSSSNSINSNVDESGNYLTSNIKNTLPQQKPGIYSVDEVVSKHLPDPTINTNELGKAPLLLIESLNTDKHIDQIVEAKEYNFESDKTAVKVNVDLGIDNAKTGILNNILINSNSNTKDKNIVQGDGKVNINTSTVKATEQKYNDEIRREHNNIIDKLSINREKLAYLNGEKVQTKIYNPSSNSNARNTIMKSVKSADVLNPAFSSFYIKKKTPETNGEAEKQKNPSRNMTPKSQSPKLSSVDLSYQSFITSSEPADSSLIAKIIKPQSKQNLDVKTSKYFKTDGKLQKESYGKNKSVTSKVDNWLWIYPKARIIKKGNSGQDKKVEAKSEQNNKIYDDKRFKTKKENQDNITKKEQNRLTEKGKHKRPGQVWNKYSTFSKRKPQYQWKYPLGAPDFIDMFTDWLLNSSKDVSRNKKKIRSDQQTIFGQELGNTAVKKYNRDLTANRPASIESLAKSTNDNQDLRQSKNNEQGIVKFKDNPSAFGAPKKMRGKITNELTNVNHLSDTIVNSKPKKEETKVRKISNGDNKSLMAHYDINVNNLASLEEFLSSSIGSHAKTKNNLWNFSTINSKQRAKQSENRHSHSSQPSSQINVVNHDRVKQAIKSSYDTSIPKKNLTILPQFGGLKINVGGFSHGLPASLSKLHQKLQQAWNKRKRTYVPETKINHVALDKDEIEIGSKLVAITNQSRIMLDIPDIEARVRNRGKQNIHHHLKIPTILPYLVRSDTSNIGKGKAERTIKPNSIQNQKGINIEKDSKDIKNNVIEIVNEARESSEPKKEFTQTQFQNSKILTSLPYHVRSRTYNANGAKAIKDFTVVADNTPSLSKLPNNNIAIRSNLNFIRLVKPRVPTKRTQIVHPHANVVVRKNLGLHTKKNFKRNRNTRQDQVSSIPQKKQMNHNSASILSINRERKRRVETKTASEGRLSPLQLRRMQQAMNVMRAPGPVQTSVNRVNNFQRHAKQTISQRTARLRNTVKSNARTRTRRLRRNNVISNSVGRPGRRIQFRNHNRNFRSFPTHNVRNPAARGFV